MNMDISELNFVVYPTGEALKFDSIKGTSKMNSMIKRVSNEIDFDTVLIKRIPNVTSIVISKLCGYFVLRGQLKQLRELKRACPTRAIEYVNGIEGSVESDVGEFQLNRKSLAGNNIAEPIITFKHLEFYEREGHLAKIEPIPSGNLSPGFDPSTCCSVHVENIHSQVNEPPLQEVFVSTGPVEVCKLIRKEKVIIWGHPTLQEKSEADEALKYHVSIPDYWREYRAILYRISFRKHVGSHFRGNGW
ncbi:hypothetical protein V6N12_027922 [Hibiscus sabdariffa]|uniref:Uncharacterized protein n=1 Tax=Hibiscus sabdariffa TaxID=183260 RepID=A0ABR2F4A7_9ROSI